MVKYHYQKHIKAQYDPLVYDHLADHSFSLRNHEYELEPNLGVILQVRSNLSIGSDLVDITQFDHVFVADRSQVFVNSYR